MDSFQFGSEVSDVQENLVRLNLKVRSMIDSFASVESQEDMESLNGDIRSKLNSMRKEIQNLRDLAKKQLNLQSASMLYLDARSHEDQMTGCLEAFKKANLSCIARLNLRGREALLKPKKSDENTKLKDKEEMVSESGKATEQLKSISSHLYQTVESSRRTVDELVESSQTLNDANEEFKSMSSVIGQSRKLITKYGRRATTDRVLIMFSAAFFFAVVFYILRKRVLGPLDPFALIWSSITAFVRTVLNLIISGDNDKQDSNIQNDFGQTNAESQRNEL